MFGLTEADLTLRILGCGDGPAGFNAALTRCDGNVVSVDPLYRSDASQIRGRLHETYAAVMAQMHKNHSDYVWGAISSVEELGRLRMSAMETFLSDYDRGKNEGRYIAGELPSLPFENRSFDIALSSHFLFLYSAHLSLEFHVQALTEMLRVAHEARVFPLLTLDGAESPHLGAVFETLGGRGFEVELRRVPYEFQWDGNEMLLVRHV